MRNILLSLFLLLVCAFKADCQSLDGWTLSTRSRDNYAGISLANGRIGIVTSNHLFGVKHILLNGVYDRQNGFSGVSNAVFAPNFLNLTIHVDGREVKDNDATNWKQTLDMRNAQAVTQFDTPDAHFRYTQQALRNAPFMAMTIVEITPNRDFELEAINQTVVSSPNKDAEYNFQRITDGSESIPLYSVRCNTRHNLHQVAVCSSFITRGQKHSATVGETQSNGTCALGLKTRLKTGETYSFALAGAACTTRDFKNPANESARLVINISCQGVKRYMEEHVKEWARLWQSDIQIEGDVQSQTDVRSCLYHLYSFVGEDNRLSPSPMGLSSDGYNRHVFWDTEIWMYPPLLMLNQQMAKSCMDYRIDRIPQAQNRARMYGYRGVMFPWESDDSGEEACPVWALTGTLEQHITADIAIAAWNYYCVTKDREWLRTSGYPLISQAADFVASRMHKNSDGSYSFLNVVGADEYACNVDDNAYTNGTAQVCLKYARQAARAVGEKPRKQWEEIENNIRYHYFADGVMREHATYNGQTIKQGDVVLLAYPLGIMTDAAEIRKNLDYYDRVMDSKGPAMGSSILSILCSQLGDSEKAFRLWQRSYIPHKCPPFGVLSEGAGGNNPYFATGAGGMLQAVLCGFGGLRITERGIVQKFPCLPKQWTRLTITGVGPDHKTFVVKR